jgi:NAD(P)-dependent dehydrogenase (short-subunit alcohol dehydrogenase family)
VALRAGVSTMAVVRVLREPYKVAPQTRACVTTVLIRNQVTGPKGIRVNGVVQGVIDTNFNDDFDNEGRNARVTPMIPVGRVGTDHDVAEMIVWLLSDSAAYVGGAVIPVNGGFF